MLKICNKCLFEYEQTDEPDYPIKSALYKTNGFIYDFSVTGGYYSVELADCSRYNFSLCENCIVDMFDIFYKKPKIADIAADGQIRNEISWEDDRKSIRDTKFHSMNYSFKSIKKNNNICQFDYDCKNIAEFSYFEHENLCGDAICFKHKELLENISNKYLFVRDADLANFAFEDNFDEDNLFYLDKISNEYSKIVKNGTKLEFVPGVLYHKVFSSYEDFKDNLIKYYCEIHSLKNLFPCYKQIDFGEKVLYLFERTKEEINKIYPYDQIEESEKLFNSLSEKDGVTLLTESLGEKDNIQKLKDKIAKIDIHKLY